MLPAIAFGALVGIATDKAFDLYDDYKDEKDRKHKEKQRRMRRRRLEGSTYRPKQQSMPIPRIIPGTDSGRPVYYYPRQPQMEQPTLRAPAQVPSYSGCKYFNAQGMPYEVEEPSDTESRTSHAATGPQTFRRGSRSQNSGSSSRGATRRRDSMF